MILFSTTAIVFLGQLRLVSFPNPDPFQSTYNWFQILSVIKHFYIVAEYFLGL